MPVEFLVLHDIDLIVSHVENNMHIEEIQEGEDEDHDMEDPDIGNRFVMLTLSSRFCSASISSVKFQ